MDTIRDNAAGLSGLEQLRALMKAGTPAPIGVTLGFTLVEIEHGRAVFEGQPDRRVYNPIGSVHGGYAATLLDSACGCAVHAALGRTQGYTTLELKVAYHRALNTASGPVRAEGRILSIGRRAAFAEATLKDSQGRLCASATSTLLVFDLPPHHTRSILMTSSLGTALVTGASSGIGAVYADRLAKRGYDLILVARDATRMETLATRLRAEADVTVDVLRADLTDRADLAQVEARLAAEATITLLVNNAGMSLKGNLLDSDVGDVEALIALNVTAPTLLAGAAARAFLTRGTGGIVTIASVLALAPELYDGVYSGSKAFVLNLSQSLAGLLEPQGVRIQVVLPGATRTEIWARSGKDIDAFPAEMVMDVEDLVDAAITGFLRGETVTIPPLADERGWHDMTAARLALAPHLSRRQVATRYN